MNTSSLNFSKRAAWILFWTTQLTAIALAISLNLTDEEAYYWSWSKLPDLSYFDHPPIQAWVTGILTFFLGDHAWVVRLPALAGHVITIGLIYLLAKKLYNESVAVITVLFAMGSLILMIGSTIAIPDAFATPLCLLAIYFTEDKKPKSAVLAVGFAVLSKWTSLFITPILLYRFWKQGLSKTKLLSQIILIPVVIQLPVILWNIHHHFISLKFHLEDRQSHDIHSIGTYIGNIFDFLGSQIFSLGPAGLVLIIFAIIVWKKSSQIISTGKKAIYWSTILWALPGFIVVAISGFQGQQRFYWTNISLLMTEIFLVAYVLEIKPHWEVKLAKWATSFSAVTWVVLFLAVMIPFGQITAQITKNQNWSAPSLKTGLLLWPLWIENSISQKDLSDPELALITSDIHSASQLMWAVGAKNILRVRLGQNPHQFAVWETEYPRHFTKALFLADFRHEDKYMFKNLCATPVEWHTDEIIADSCKVGEIYWARCDHLQ